MPKKMHHPYKNCLKSPLPLSVALMSILFTSSHTVFADLTVDNDDEITTKNQLEVFSITATRNARDPFLLPMQVTVIENSKVNQHAFTANDLLRKDASVQVTGTQRTNGQNLTLRGYDKRGILIEVDGIKQGTDTGHMDGTFIDSSLIKRVEIVKGSNGLLYGSGALGGVISYQTVDATDLLDEGKNFGMTHFVQGATGDSSIGTGATFYGRSDNSDGLISGVFRQRGDLKQSGLNSPNDEEIQNLLAKGNWYFAPDHKLSSQFRFYQNQALQPKNPQQNETSNIQFQAQNQTEPLVNRKTKQTDINLDYQYNPRHSDYVDLSLLFYHQTILIDQNDNKLNSFESREQNKNGVKIENKSSLKSLPLAAHDFTYGSEYYKEEQKPNEAVKNIFPEAKIDFSSAWLQDELTLRDLPASLIIGTRYDNYHAKNPIYTNIEADQWSSKAGITINPIDWLMIYSAYSEAFRSPTLSELYNDSQHFAMGPFYTNHWVPNPNLRPERNKTYEVGFGLRGDDLLIDNDNMSFKATYFDTDARDYIATVVDLNFSRPPQGLPPNMPYGKGTTMAKNIQKASIHGYEVEFAYQTPLINSSASYSRTRGKDDNTHAWLENITPDAIHTVIEIPVRDSGFTVSWLGQFVEKSTRVATTTSHQAGYGINSFYISYDNSDILPNIALAIGLENAFDKHYFSPQGIPQPRNNAQFKASYRF